MTDSYDDGTLVCGPERLDIRFYYFPAGTKRIPYTQIQGLQRVEIKGLLSGRWRIWGTGNPRYWANLDVRRPQKRVGFVIDVGRRIKPFVSPDRPDEFEAVVRAQAKLGPGDGRPSRGPLL